MADKRLMNENSMKNLRNNGRQKGSGNKLGATFKDDLLELWNSMQKGEDGKYSKRGQALLRKAADKDPLGFVKMMATLVPKEVTPLEEAKDKASFAETLMRMNDKTKNTELEDAIIDVDSHIGRLGELDDK
tara:strand:- start:227 stop:619 length:393 start_codon:yes stop_codon:yes gene_type:complete